MNSHLMRRVAFTLGALLAYRIGSLRTIGEAYHPEALDLRFVTSAE